MKYIAFMDEPESQATTRQDQKVGRRVLVELLLVGSLLELSASRSYHRVSDLPGGSFLSMLAQFSRPDITVSFLNLLLPAMLFLRMTWWNAEEIDFGFRKRNQNALICWAIGTFGVLLILWFLLRAILPATDFVLAGQVTYIQDIVAWKQNQGAVWYLAPLLTSAFLGPLWTSVYLQGLVSRYLKDSSLVPWLVMLVFGLASLPSGSVSVTVGTLVVGAILAWVRTLSRSAWPSIIGGTSFIVVTAIISSPPLLRW